MYNNFPSTKSPTKSPEKNPLQSIVQKYNTTLNEIESEDTVDRALVDEFFDIKKQVADIYNSMRNNGPPLMTPGNTMTPYVPPQALAASNRSSVGPIFLSDMYNGYNGPNDNKSQRALVGNDYAVRNEIESNQFAQQQQFQRMQQRNNPNVNAPMFAKRCINSSFNNALNQNQFRSDADVVMMQADNGSLVPINNANVYDRSGLPRCNQAFDQNYIQNEEYNQQNMPMLKSVTKQQYQQNLAKEMARQNEVRDVTLNPWNNISTNPIWKPVSNKYVD